LLKTSCRSRILEDAKSFDPSVNFSLSKIIFEKTIKLLKHIQSVNIHFSPFIVGIYYPINAEPDLMRLSLTEEIITALPRIDSAQKKIEMKMYGMNNPYLQDHPYISGLYEPTENSATLNPQVIIVPGLAYDIFGYRLGYGGGFYDRYISEHKMQSNIITIGVCFDRYLVERLPTYQTDVKFDYVITDKNMIKL
jgi:5-formyltetrahydrofolate cyclo-ligase